MYQNRRWDSDLLTLRRVLREGTLGEDEPPLPANPYGTSKLAAEHLIGAVDMQPLALHLAGLRLIGFHDLSHRVVVFS